MRAPATRTRAPRRIRLGTARLRGGDAHRGKLACTEAVPIAAVIFDLDDTLMPEHPADYAALEATAGALPDDASLQPVEFRRVVVDGARSQWERTPMQTYAHTIGTSALEMLWAPEDRSKPGLALLTDFAPGIRESVW